MHIAIIGPTHPYKGGVALHTTELAHRLSAAGHKVEIVSWRRQYPALLYPGEQRVPGGKAEIQPFEHTTEPLTWYNPLSWWRTGRQLRTLDLVIITYFVPYFQATSGLVMLRAIKSGGGRQTAKPRVLALCHNVLQHDPHPGDRLLTRMFLSRVDGVITHSKAQAVLARTFTGKPILKLKMAPHLPAAAQDAAPHAAGIQKHLLFFGLVRAYKGVDILLRALAQNPGIAVTIAGEARIKTELDALIAELGLQDRVTFTGEYVDATDIPQLFAAADALVLPYRSGTATQNVELGFAFGVPVIATRVGSMTASVRDDIDGLLCEPDDVAALAAAIKHFYEPGVAARLRKGVPRASVDAEWRAYVKSITAALPL